MDTALNEYSFDKAFFHMEDTSIFSDLFKDTFTDSGSINVEGATLHCWKHGGHGTQTYLEVVENSCNLLVNTGTHLSLLRTL